MADDRVYIRCKYCEGWKMLLKYSCITGSTHRDNGILEWLDKHALCHPSIYDDDLGGEPGFTLHTDSGDAKKVLLIEKQNYAP